MTQRVCNRHDNCNGDAQKRDVTARLPGYPATERDATRASPQEPTLLPRIPHM